MKPLILFLACLDYSYGVVKKDGIGPGRVHELRRSDADDQRCRCRRVSDDGVETRGCRDDEARISSVEDEISACDEDLSWG